MTASRGQTLSFQIDGATATLQRAEPTAGAFFRAFRPNASTGKWDVDVTVTNGSARTLRAPIVLRFDMAEQVSPGIVGAIIDAAGQPFLILMPMLTAGELKPGEALPPFTLSLGDGRTRPTLAAGVYSAPEAPLIALAAAQTLGEDGTPLENVSIQEIGPGAARTFTSARGGWTTLEIGADVLGWRFTAPGKATSFRKAPPTGSERITELASPRLATLNATSPTIFSPQTIPAPIPTGWSPLTAALIGSEATTLELNDVIENGANVFLVRWDESSLDWKAIRAVPVGSLDVATDAGSPGLVAVLRADAAPVAPAAPSVGQSIQGIASALSADTLAATAFASPASRVASRDPVLVRTDATVEFTSSAGALSSGVTVPCEVSEEYRLRDGSRRVLPSYRTVLVAYQRPPGATPGSVVARFTLRPLQLLGGDELDQAIVRVQVLKPGAFAGAVIDAAGGTISAGATRISIAANDFERPQAILLRDLNLGVSSEIAPPGLELIRAFELNAGGVASGKKLAVTFGAQTANSTFVLARAIFDEGRHGFQPVQRFVTDALGAIRSIEPSSGGLTGIDGGGQFVLFRTGAAEAVISGVARDAASAPKRGLVVRRGPWMAFSDEAGAFRLLAPAGSSDVTALDTASGDIGTTAIETPVDLAAVQASVDTIARGPRIVAVSPIDGAANVPRITAVTLTFDKPMNAGSLLGDRLVLKGKDGTIVPATLSLNLKGTIATLLPLNPLDPSVRHTIAVSPLVADIGGKQIEGPLSFSFTTESDSLDRVAGRLTIYEPLDGFAPVSGSPGSADAEAPVILVNETSGQTATVLSKVDGSFTNKITADVDDIISAVIVSRNGERVTLNASRQIFRDGRIGLFSAGGTIDVQGENGAIQAIVEPGSISGKNIFTIAPVSIAQLQGQVGPLPEEDHTRILGGVSLSTTGPDLSHSVDISIPINIADLSLAAGESPTNRVFALCIPRVIDGVSVFEIVDNMQFENGRLVTHSPPFPGADLQAATATFAAMMMGFFPQRLVIVGQAVRVSADADREITDDDVRAGQTKSGKPIVPMPGAIVTADRQASQSGSLRAGAFLARCNSRGFFALNVPFNTFTPDPILMRARHPILPNQYVARVFTPPGLANAFNVGTVANFIFRSATAGDVDEIAPIITPDPPSANLPFGQPVTFDLIVRDDQSDPVLDSVDFIQAGSIQLSDGQPVTSGMVAVQVGSAVAAGPLTVRVPVTFRVDSATLVNFEAVAHDVAGNSRTQALRFHFGAAPAPSSGPLTAGDPHDETRPRVVSMSPSNGEFIETPQILYQFSEPIDSIITNLNASFSISPSAGKTALLSKNQREFLVQLSGLKAGQDYTVTLHSSGVRDISLNGNYMASDMVSAFHTPAAPSADLQDSIGAIGSVQLGTYSFTIVRRGTGGELQAHRIGDTNQTQLEGRLSLPFFPRAIEAVGAYSFKRATNGPVETNQLVLVAGGALGTDEAGQVLWVVNVSNPAAPVRLASELVSVDPAVAINGIRWRPPYLFLNESHAEISTIDMINLQAFILGGNGTFTGGDYVPGVDANGDGDFVDTGDSLPIPHTQSVFGLERSTGLGLNRFPIDFDALDNGAFMAAILAKAGGEPARLQVVFSKGEFIGAGSVGSPEGSVLFANRDPLRVLLDIGLPVETSLGRKFIIAAIVLVDGAVEIYDLTNPVVPALVRKITLGLGTPTALTLQRSGEDEYTVGTKDSIYTIKRSTMSLPPDGNGVSSGITVVYTGTVVGRSAGATDIDYVSATGGLAREILRAPTLKIVNIPGFPVTNILGVVAQGDSAVRNFLDGALEFPFLMPAITMNCPGDLPSPLGDPSHAPDSTVHHYVIVRVSGENGATLNIALESLDIAHQLNPAIGKDYPAILLSSEAATIGLSNMMPATQPLVAHRLSSDKFSDLYNTYVTDAFVVVPQKLELDEVHFVDGDGRNRKAIWSGEFIRCSIDPLNVPASLAPYQSEGVAGHFHPGVSRTYRSLRAEFRDSPNPSFALAAPRHGGVDLQSGEFRHPQTDIFIEGSEQPLSLSRVYESRSRYFGPFGRGWDFNLNLRLVEYALDLGEKFAAPNCLPGSDNHDLLARAGDVMFYDGAGGAFRFHRISAENGNENNKALYADDPAITEFLGLNGVSQIDTFYESPEGVFFVLYKLTDESWWMVGPTGIQFFFDGSGRATKIHGRSKKSEILFTYRDDGKLDEVKGDRGVKLMFGYYYKPPAVLNSGGLLDVVSDKPTDWGRIARVKADPIFMSSAAVEFEYDEFGNLRKSKPKDFAETVHTYDQNNPDLMLSVGRGDGTEQPGIKIGYDPQTALVTGATFDGENRTYSGAVKTARDRHAAGDTTVSVSRNSVTASFKIDDRGRPTTFANRPFGADDQGRVTKVAGELDKSTLVYDVNNTVYRFRGNLTRTERESLSGGGKFITETHYDGTALNRPDSETDVNGVTTTIQYSAGEFTETIGGLINRRVTQNDFNQSEQTILSGNGQFEVTSILTSSSPTDQGLINGEQSGSMPRATLSRDTHGRIQENREGSHVQTTHYNDDSQPDHISGTDVPDVTTTFNNLLKETEKVTSAAQAMTESFVYSDSRHKANVTQLTSEETGLPPVVTVYHYDDSGRVTGMIVANETTILSYDGTRQTGLAGPGVANTSGFDGFGRMTNLVQNGISVDFTYDANGRMATIDQQGAKTFFEYDDVGARLRTRLKLKRVESDGATLLKETYTYDAAGRVQDATSLGGRVKTFTWYPDNHVKSVTIDGSLLQDSDRDTAGRLTRSKLNDVETIYGQFDASTGLPLSEDLTFLPSGRSLHRGNSYDTSGRLHRVTLPAGSYQFDHDGFGHITSRKDPDGVEVKSSYSPSGNLLSSTFSDGDVATYGFTPQRRVHTVSTPIGSVVYDHGSDGQVSSMTLPDGVITKLQNRNQFFEPETVILGDGEVTQTQSFYADTGRLESISAGTDQMHYSYDALGRPTESSYNGNSVTHLYNIHGEAVGEDTDVGQWLMTLDSRNRVLTEDYPSGLQLNFAPDPFGLPTSVSAVGISSFVWVGAGVWSEIRLNGGLVLSRTYDTSLRLDSIAYGSAAGFKYKLSAGGRILHEERTHENRFDVFTRNNPSDGMRIVRFDFGATNDAGSGAIASLVNLSFVNGELHAPAQGTLAEPRGYFPALTFNGPRVITADSDPVQYNKRGSVTNAPLYVRLPGATALTKVQATLEYDSFSMLRKISRGDGVTISYDRDGLGRIIHREVVGPANLCEPGVRQFVWKGMRLLEERDEVAGAFQLVRRYVYVGETLVLVQRAATPGAALVDFVPLLNVTGSICGYLSRAGAVVETIAYSAYGYPVFNVSGDAASSSVVGDTILFHGCWFDPAAGLYQMGERNLHPILARFLQHDNAVFLESLAFFAAFDGDPAGRVDHAGAASTPEGPMDLYNKGIELQKLGKGAVDSGRKLEDVLNQLRGYPGKEPITYTEAGMRTANFLGAVAKLAGFQGDTEIVNSVKDVTTGVSVVTGVMRAFEVNDFLAMRHGLKNFQVATWARDPRNAPRFGNLHELGASFDLLNLKDLESRFPKRHRMMTEDEAMSRSFLGLLEKKRGAYPEARAKVLLNVGKTTAQLGKLYFDHAYKDDNSYIVKVSGGVLETASSFFAAIDAYQTAKKADDLQHTFKAVSGTFNELTGFATSKAGRAAIGAAFDAGFAAGKLIAVAVSDPDVAQAYLEQVKQFQENGAWFTVAGGVLSTIGADGAAQFIQDLHDTPLTDYIKPIIAERERNVERTQYYLKGLNAP